MRINLLKTVAIVVASGLWAVPGCVATSTSALQGTWLGILNQSITTQLPDGTIVTTNALPPIQLVYAQNGTLVSYPFLPFGNLQTQNLTINQLGQTSTFNVTLGGITYNGVATVTDVQYSRNSTLLTVAISLTSPLSTGSGVQTIETALNSTGTLGTTVTQNISYNIGGATTNIQSTATGSLVRQ